MTPKEKSSFHELWSTNQKIALAILMERMAWHAESGDVVGVEECGKLFTGFVPEDPQLKGYRAAGLEFVQAFSAVVANRSGRWSEAVQMDEALDFEDQPL